MYFSVLPLLLLFASTICALPTLWGKGSAATMEIGGVQLSTAARNDYTFCAWNEYEIHGTKGVEGVTGARTLTLRKDTLVRVEVAETDVKPVKKIIDELKVPADLWGWNFKGHGQVVFVIELTNRDAKTAEQIVQHYLKGHINNNPVSPTAMSLHTKQDV